MEHREPTRRARDVSVSRAVLQFALAGLAAVALFAVVALLVLRELGRREAIRNAEQFAVLAGQGIVEPALDDGLLTGDGAARARIDRLVQERVLSDRVVRVKIWTADGRIVYSDEPRLVGSTYPLGKDELAVLRSGATEAELSDLSKPENRFDRGQGSLYEVYTRVRTPSGTPLMFEMYQRSNSLVSRGREIWLPFAAALLAGLLLLWAVQVPLAWRLARRLQRSQAEREGLLVHAVEASADERRRVAADLHDGVVQDLAGVSYSLSAAADRAAGHDSPEAVGALRSGAASLRGAIRQLRTLLVAIHPPNLQSAGLRAALTDLLAPLEADGLAIELDVPDELDLSADEERLLFRAAAEALRNVRRHARATRVSVRITLPPGRVVLAIEDDGAGFDRDERERRRAEGHVGLSLLGELAKRAGGTLEVRSEPGSGTVLTMELPRS